MESLDSVKPVQRSAEDIRKDLKNREVQYWLPGMTGGDKGGIEAEMDSLEVELEEALRREVGYEASN